MTTAKQAIKARCLDCFGHKCTEVGCPLFGLMKPQAGVNRIDAIRYYCRWCMNRNPVNQCASPNCSIYQYRAVAKGNVGVVFLPVLPPQSRIDGNRKQSSQKPVPHVAHRNESYKIANNGGSHEK